MNENSVVYPLIIDFVFFFFFCLKVISMIFFYCCSCCYILLYISLKNFCFCVSEIKSTNVHNIGKNRDIFGYTDVQRFFKYFIYKFVYLPTVGWSDPLMG